MKEADRLLLRQRMVDLRETLDRCYKLDRETADRRAALNEAALNTIISSLLAEQTPIPSPDTLKASLRLATINELVAELSSRFKDAPKCDDSPDSGEHHQ